MAVDQSNDQLHMHSASVRELANELFQDLSDELKQEILEIRSGEQPVEPQADLIVRKHLMGIIVLLFGLVALILLVSIIVIDLYAHAHS
jgi:hypothetical protein